MTTLDRTNHETADAGFNLYGFIRHAARLSCHVLKVRSERAALQATPDYLLKDMGISRSEIPHYTSIRYAMLNQGRMGTGNFR
ncbi:DUF1127 domain-containing protein [Mesorhizobium sp. ArgA1]